MVKTVSGSTRILPFLLIVRVQKGSETRIGEWSMTDALRSDRGIAHSRVLVRQDAQFLSPVCRKDGQGSEGKKVSGRPKSPFSPCGRRSAGGDLQERVVGEAPVCHLPFQASGHPNSPFSPCGRRGLGGCLQRWVFGEAPMCHLSFQASGHPNSPFSPCG